MSIFLQRIDGVPLQGNDQLTMEIQRWMVTLVDTLNTVIESIEPLLINPMGISDTTQDAEINTSYIPNSTDVGGTAITLPAVAPVDSIVEVIGQGVGGWTLLPNSGQTIQLLGSTASVSVGSADRYDTIAVKCVVDDTTWVVMWSESSGLIIT